MNILHAEQRLFPGRLRCDNPDVVIKVTNWHQSVAYAEKTISGSFYRVSPQCSKEVFALQMMENQHDKFPPAKDNGIIVSAEALARLDAKVNF